MVFEDQDSLISKFCKGFCQIGQKLLLFLFLNLFNTQLFR